MSRIRGALKLLQHSLARQSKSLPFSDTGRRLCRQSGPRLRRLFIGLRLLGFDGFALPSPGHFSNYSSRWEDWFVGMHIASAQNPFVIYKNGTALRTFVCLLTAWV